jgi:histidyl-tRNA synthetase
MIKKKVEGENQGQAQSVKGMRDILGDEYYAYQGFFEKAAEVAIYYGFTPIDTPMLEQESLFSASSGESSDIVSKEMYTLRTKGGDQLALRPEVTAPIMRAYLENGLQSLPQPVMLYFYGPVFRHDKPQRGRYRQFWQFDLESIGTAKSIADAMIIKLTLLILEEAGLKDLVVEINSIGDKECRPTYRRELVNYYKKHVKELCADCRERLKTNPLRLLDCKNPKCQELKAEAPSALNHLCHACKAHFKEVLEYLETMGVRYEINNNLVRGLDYYTRTVFEISEVMPPVEGATEEAQRLAIASGGRYDYLAKALGYKKEIPAVGVGIGVERVMLSPNATKLTTRLVKKPKIFFIQLSFEAKLKSLVIIEILRKAKIPTVQTITKDSLGAQLAIAEKMKVPYTLILGQKEVIENCVIVRNMDTRSQENVKIENLAEYVKHLK